MSGFKYKYTVLVILFFICQIAVGQKYQFKQYSLEEGLSNPFVYSVCQDQDGFIWIGTGEGLCRFDGFEFVVSVEDDSLTNGYVSSSYLDQKGTLWFGHNTGQITFYNGKEFKLLNDGGIAKSSITTISGDKSGNIYFATQNNGILKTNKSLKVDIFQGAFEGKLIYSLLAVGDKNLLVGTSDGLGVYSVNGELLKELFSIKELDYISIISIKKGIKENTFWIGTEDSGFFLLKAKGENFESYEIENIGEQYEIGYENVQSILEDKAGILWICSYGKGVFKLIPDENNEYKYKDVVNYNTTNGLPNDFIKDMFIDWEGNQWIATYGKGLAFSVDEAFTIHYQDIKELNKNILSVSESKNYLWLGGDKVLVKVDKETNLHKILNQSNGLPADKIVALYADPNNNLWIGTEKSGIYMVNNESNRVQNYFQANNSLGNRINSITGFNDMIYVSTKNGIWVFNLNNNKRTLFNTSVGLPHNDIKFVFVDAKHKPWVATNSNGIFMLDIDSVKVDSIIQIESNANLKFTSIAQDSDASLWAATDGNGVFRFEKDTLINYSVENGLKSDYCYSLIADNYGKVWVGHRLGISGINIKTEEVKIYSKELGISGDCNENAVLKQESGVILTGTTDGLVKYDATKEKQNILAPKLNINRLDLSDKSIDFKKEINLPYDIYKMKISFVGLSYSNPEGVTYQYKLDGYDLDWSEVTKNRLVNYPRVEDGNFTFMVKACNSAGICVEEPLKVKIIVRPPIWKRWWFITLMALIGIVLIYSYIKYRERKQKALQEYLENELAARTKEVVAQKDELEIKNRDITDSINYAQRIQQSILPSVMTINENFSGAFVYYNPRDIVSGDFYWYDRVNDDKFLIVCADSTGHGVPGAFMSMIGTTLIKDICLRKDIDSPSAILQSLDKELQSTLNQNIEAERANDGMDIIVCEIDVNTHYMRFASAMRPLILYKDKELQYVKGTKASIGGDPKAEKRFENVGFQLSTGDTIYMFSDGYPDQFGGPRGKKFKMDRVKNMLADVCDKPMEIQQEYVDKTFKEWKGKLQQVDDVLFMGVRV